MCWEKYFVVILFAVLGFSGCSKESPTQPELNSIYGEWTLVKLSGGWTGREEIPDSDIKIRISQSGYFYEYENNKEKYTASFEIIKEKSIYSEDLLYFIRLSNTERFPHRLAVIEMTATTLVLADDCNDGYLYHYKLRSRIK